MYICPLYYAMDNFVNRDGTTTIQGAIWIHNWLRRNAGIEHFFLYVAASVFYTTELSCPSFCPIWDTLMPKRATSSLFFPLSLFLHIIALGDRTLYLGAGYTSDLVRAIYCKSQMRFGVSAIWCPSRITSYLFFCTKSQMRFCVSAI
jgi:hypothetical protein